MSGIGHGESFKFASQTLPGVEDVKFNNKGQILSKVVADQSLPISDSVPGLAKFTVVWNLPATTPHSVLAAVAQGLTGAIEWDDVDGIKVSAANGISNGYDIGAPASGWVTVTSEFSASGAVTVGAASA